MVRLLRVGRLTKVIGKLHEMIDSEYLSIAMEIVSMIVVMMGINHFISCIWYVIAHNADGASWINVHGFAEDELRASGRWYLYLTSFHWGITQFTPASMHVQPQNTMERGYAVVVVVFALVVFSYVVGSITGSLTQL